MKRILLLLISVTFYFFSFSQEGLDDIVEIHTNILKETPDVDTTAKEKLWKFGGNFSLTFSQVSLTNWVSGGENAISGAVGTLIAANYTKGKTKWDNTLDIGYGLTKQGEDKVIKNEDKIDFSSQFGKKASDKWLYSSLIGFKTQFAEGYSYPNDSVVISNFLAPAYIIISGGMDYRPSDKLSLFLSPITGRLTIVTDQELSDKGAFGVEKGSNTRSEMGGFVRIVYQDKFFSENFSIRSKLELFSNYIEKPENIDINWDVSLNLRLGNYITARFQTLMVYDDDMVAKLQVKELFGIGFSYRF
jgi:hypothetical protein